MGGLKRNRDCYDDCTPHLIEAIENKIRRDCLSKNEMSDLTIAVRIPCDNAPDQLSTFSINSTLLVASSPVFFQRLHGPLAEKKLLDLPRSERVLTINGDKNHKHFSKLLDFIQGRVVLEKLRPHLFPAGYDMGRELADSPVGQRRRARYSQLQSCHHTLRVWF